MPFSGLSFKQLVPRPLTPFAFINDLYYNPSTNLIWVADIQLRTQKIPVLNASTGALVHLVDLSGIPNWPSGSFNDTGASSLIADSTYVYASSYGVNAGYPIIAVIRQSDYSIVGIINGLVAGNPNLAVGVNVPGQMVVVGSNIYVPGQENTAHNISPYINVAEFSVTSALSSYPTSVGSSAANITAGSTWNARTIAASSSTLYLGTANSAVPVGSTEYLYETDLSMTGGIVYTNTDSSSNSYYNYLNYAFGSIYAAIGNAIGSPYHHFDSSTAQIYKNGSPFITFPTTTPNLTGAGATRITADTYNETLLISCDTSSQYGPGILLRYDPISGSLLSYFGNPNLAQLNIVTAAQITPSTIWMSSYDPFGTVPNKMVIKVFSSGIGTETLLTTITGY